MQLSTGVGIVRLMVCFRSHGAVNQLSDLALLKWIIFTVMTSSKHFCELHRSLVVCSWQIFIILRAVGHEKIYYAPPNGFVHCGTCLFTRFSLLETVIFFVWQLNLMSMFEFFHRVMEKFARVEYYNDTMYAWWLPGTQHMQATPTTWACSPL